VLHDQHPEVCILVFCYGNADFPRHCSPKSDDRACFFRGLLMKWSWVETTRLGTRRWPISMLKGDIQFGKTMGQMFVLRSARLHLDLDTWKWYWFIESSILQNSYHCPT
jgi:hypothetical protein